MTDRALVSRIAAAILDDIDLSRERDVIRALQAAGYDHGDIIVHMDEAIELARRNRAVELQEHGL